jgi:tRNA A37 threonylcarbamoyladenosine biosynthesis protein TsaE
VAIEWADRIPSALPPDHLEIELQRPGAGEHERMRIISASAHGWLAASVLRRWGLCLGVSGAVQLESVACP